MTLEQKNLKNIKKIYQNAGKCDDQQNLKDIIDADMVSTPEEVTEVSPSLRITQTKIKNPSDRNSLCYSPTYLMLKEELISAVLNLQNKNSEPLKLEISCVPVKQN